MGAGHLRMPLSSSPDFTGKHFVNDANISKVVANQQGMLSFCLISLFTIADVFLWLKSFVNNSVVGERSMLLSCRANTSADQTKTGSGRRARGHRPLRRGGMRVKYSNAGDAPKRVPDGKSGLARANERAKGGTPSGLSSVPPDEPAYQSHAARPCRAGTRAERRRPDGLPWGAHAAPVLISSARRTTKGRSSSWSPCPESVRITSAIIARL